MVGGKVIEVCEIPNRPGVLWINCADRPYGRIETCSVLCELNDDAKQIQIGDSVWWQCGRVYWTPQDRNRIDIAIPKIGGSGVTYETACGVEV